MNTLDTQRLASFNVLLIGDSCTDTYNVGTVERLSPEAPVPVLKIKETFNVLGMAANVKQNFVNLGCDIELITNGESIIKTRYIDSRSGQHLLRVDDEDTIIPWSGRIPVGYEDYDAIVISDYNKGFLTYEHIAALVHYAKCPVFIDTKKPRLADISPPFKSNNIYVKINEVEYKNAMTLSDNLIVTLGDKGAQYKGTVYPTKKVEVMDVCGCGDTFLAALVTQYLFTKDIEKSILFANAASGLTVQHRGNYAPTYDEIINAGY